MRTVIINTFEKAGGAARAAHRLHYALRSRDIDSSMAVMSRQTDDPTVFEFSDFFADNLIDYNYILRKLVHRHFIDSCRTELSNTLFSFAYAGCDLASDPLLQSADLINLHWVGWFQTPATIHNLLRLGKPVVWTLHDMCPFTGGCHYSAGCDGYTRHCQDCQQLSSDPYSLPQAIFNDKRQLFAGFPLTIVSPSRWLAACARNSTLFKDCRIEVIPNCIETDIYLPMDKHEAKKGFGIEADKIVLMFGADSSNEKRKGFAEFGAALGLARKEPSFDEMARDGRITILALGPLTAEVLQLGLPVMALGHVNDDLAIARAYSAADIFILPSLEDNLPNMMLESMACGTSILAFEAGGIPDVVQHGVNGSLVPVGDVGALAAKLIELVSGIEIRERMGAAASAYAHKAFAPKIQSDHYIALFEDLLCHSGGTQAIAMTGPNGTGEPVEFGSHFDAIRHKVMLDALLKSLPGICQAYGSEVLDHDVEQINRLQHNIDALTQSLSWRLTAPLRKILKAVRRES